jgi:hypothetical protein
MSLPHYRLAIPTTAASAGGSARGGSNTGATAWFGRPQTLPPSLTSTSTGPGATPPGWAVTCTIGTSLILEVGVAGYDDKTCGKTRTHPRVFAKAHWWCRMFSRNASLSFVSHTMQCSEGVKIIKGVYSAVVRSLTKELPTRVQFLLVVPGFPIWVGGRKFLPSNF